MKLLDQYDETFVEGGFDAVADSYGEVLFLRRAAQALVELADARPARRMLDIATGPGTLAMLLAQRSSEREIVGIDVAPAMIAAANARAEQLGLAHVGFQTASALDLPFEEQSFDAVLCSNAIYYMADFDQALREWARVLRPGGMLAFSSFGVGVLEPMSSLFDARIRAHGIVVPQPTPLFRLNTAAACRALLDRAGLDDITIHEPQLGYWVRDETAWWQMLMSTGFQALVAALDPAARAEFESEHLREVRPHVTDRGLWIDVPVIVAAATKRV